MNKKITKKITICFTIFIICIFVFSIVMLKQNEDIELASTQESVSNKKIGWGIKRGDNHNQPNLGEENKRIIDKYKGISMGNSEKNYIYLTFDCGYEAGYTEKILEVLKENDVKAAFFITAHYLNTQEELVKKMIDEGHIVGNHTPNYLMSGNDIKVKC